MNTYPNTRKIVLSEFNAAFTEGKYSTFIIIGKPQLTVSLQATKGKRHYARSIKINPKSRGKYIMEYMNNRRADATDNF